MEWAPSEPEVAGGGAAHIAEARYCFRTWISPLLVVSFKIAFG
jgi:hypothetical protein